MELEIFFTNNGNVTGTTEALALLLALAPDPLKTTLASTHRLATPVIDATTSGEALVLATTTAGCPLLLNVAVRGKSFSKRIPSHLATLQNFHWNGIIIAFVSIGYERAFTIFHRTVTPREEKV